MNRQEQDLVDSTIVSLSTITGLETTCDVFDDLITTFEDVFVKAREYSDEPLRKQTYLFL